MFPIKLSIFLFLLSYCESFSIDINKSPGWMESCRKTKGREAVDDVLKKWDEARECFGKITGSFPSGSGPDDLTGRPEAACKSKAALQKCLEPTAAAVQKCLSEKGKLDVEVQKTAVIEGFNYLCAKDGNRLKELWEYKYSLGPHEEELISKKCQLSKFVNAMIDYQQETTIFNQTVCRLHEEVKHCIVQTVNNASSTLVPIAKGLLDAMKIPCNRNDDAAKSPSKRNDDAAKSPSKNAGNAIFQFSSWIMISTLLLIISELICL